MENHLNISMSAYFGSLGLRHAVTSAASLSSRISFPLLYRTYCSGSKRVTIAIYYIPGSSRGSTGVVTVGLPSRIGPWGYAGPRVPRISSQGFTPCVYGIRGPGAPVGLALLLHCFYCLLACTRLTLPSVRPVLCILAGIGARLATAVYQALVL